MIYLQVLQLYYKNCLWFKILEFDICDIYESLHSQDQRRMRLPLLAKMSASVSNHIILKENPEQQYL